MYSDQLLSIDQLLNINTKIMTIRGNTPGCLAIPADRKNNREQNDKLVQIIDENLTSYQPFLVTDKEQEVYGRMAEAWVGYKKALAEYYPIVDSGDNEKALYALTKGDLVSTRKA